MEKIKLKIELLSKKIDIVKSKLLVFSAGIAGCWAFISSHYNNVDFYNVDFLVIISLILIFVFGFGVGMNLLKFSDLTQKIDELDKELNNE